MIKYEFINDYVFNLMPKMSKSILDIGCGTGGFGQRLKAINTQIIVDGITYSNEEKEVAEKYLDNVYVQDINASVIEFKSKYDCVVLSHVLEHTLKPKDIYENVIDNIEIGSYVLIALPNVLFYKQRLKFLLGEFKYSKNGGLMDETHYHFFSWDEALVMIKDVRITLEKTVVEGAAPLLFLRRILPNRILKEIDLFFGRVFPGLFGLQFCFLIRKVRE